MSKIVQVDPSAINNVISNAKARQIIYSVIILSGIILGAIGVGVGANVPEWVEIATRVYVFLSAAMGGLALTNTPGNKNQEVVEYSNVVKRNTHRKDV